MQNLQELPKFRDGLSYVYLEHGHLEQQDRAVAFYGAEGVVAIPAASLGLLMLGPGTTVTHAAIRSLADNGCTVLWVGEDSARFYASGLGETRSSANLLRQARAWADPSLHLAVVQRLYRMRFPDPLPANLSLEQLRGMEGVRVRTAYAQASRETGVPWSGRNYNRGNWASADPVNRALSAGAAVLYGVVQAAIVSAGYSTALGFIHTGKQLSFVYDVADLYKAEVLIPAAFRAATASTAVEQRVRLEMRGQMREQKMLERVVDDLHHLFAGLGESADGDDPYANDPARPGQLWDLRGEVPGGRGYGVDHAAAGPEDSAGRVDPVDG